MKRIDATELLDRTSMKSNEMIKRLERYDNTIGKVITSPSSTILNMENRLICGVVTTILLAVILYIIKPSLVMDSEVNPQTHFRVLSMNIYKVGGYSIGCGILLSLFLMALSK